MIPTKAPCPINADYTPIKADYAPIKADYAPIKVDYAPIKTAITNQIIIAFYITGRCGGIVIKNSRYLRNLTIHSR